MILVLVHWVIKVVVKLFMAGQVASVSMRADAFNNIADIAEGTLVLLAVWMVRRPSDRTYPLGRSNVEHIATLIIGLGLLALGLNVFVNSAFGLMLHFDVVPGLASGLLRDVPGLVSSQVLPAMVVAAVAAALSVVLGGYQVWLGKTEGYPSVRADGYGTLSDGLVETTVFLGLLLSNFGLGWLDLLAGLVVSIIVFRTAGKLVSEAVRVLMNASVPPAVHLALMEAIDALPGVTAVRQLVAYRVGRLVFAEAEVEVSVEDSTQLLGALERRIKGHFPNVGRLFLRSRRRHPVPPGRLAIVLEQQVQRLDDAIIAESITADSGLLLLQTDGAEVLTQRLMPSLDSPDALREALIEAGARQVVTGGVEPVRWTGFDWMPTHSVTVRKWLEDRGLSVG